MQGAAALAAALRRHAVCPAGTQLAVQQPQPVVSAGPDDRLRDGHDALHGARRLHGGGQRRRDHRVADALARSARTRDVYVRREAAAALPRRDRQQVLPDAKPRTSRSTSFRRRQHRTARSRRRRSRQARPAIPPIGTRNTIRLIVESNRRQQDRGRDIVSTAVEILRLYADAHRRRAVRLDDDCDGRERQAWRSQPGLLRRPEQSAAGDAVRIPRTIRRCSSTSPSSTSRTRSRTSGGGRPSAGRTTTSSGSAKASRSTSRRSTRGSAAANRRSAT